MERERRTTVRMPESLHKAVRVKAAELDRPIAEIVRELLQKWITGEIQLPGNHQEDDS